MACFELWFAVVLWFNYPVLPGVVETVFVTTSKIVAAPTTPPADPTSVYQIVTDPGRLETRATWKDMQEPGTGSRYIVAADTKHWFRAGALPFPALVSILEVKNNTDLWVLNAAAETKIGTAKAKIQIEMGAAIGGGFFLRDDGDPSDDSLMGDADSDFLVVPVIYFGNWSGSLTHRGNVAFIPGLANVQPAGPSTIIFPRTFTPEAVATDVYAQATAAIIGATACGPPDYCFTDELLFSVFSPRFSREFAVSKDAATRKWAQMFGMRSHRTAFFAQKRGS